MEAPITQLCDTPTAFLSLHLDRDTKSNIQKPIKQDTLTEIAGVPR